MHVSIHPTPREHAVDSMTPDPSEFPASGLLTDLYQITMAQGYYRCGMAEHEAVFHLTFRNLPFGGGFAIACGLDTVVDFLNRWRFSTEDLAYLGRLKGNDGNALFHADFLEYLRALRFACDVEAIAEGTPVFGHEPLVRIRGPIVQCQLLETPLLALLNFQTLIATKAARIILAADGDPVIEFGFRRSQGMNGSLAVARASYIGGCVGTSNVFAGRTYDIPVLGTHAHSWIMAFESEREAFLRYADALPNNCVFLVDTYDSISGVKHAIEAARRLQEKGHQVAGIRLDSGDLAALSIKARELLDEAGFSQAKIVASNELDEHRIRELKQAGAKIQVWGVGTRLATAYDQPALDGVYKLAGIRPDSTSPWRFSVKLSENESKVPNPGVQQVRRFFRGDAPLIDVLYNIEDAPGKEWRYALLSDPDRQESVPEHTRWRDLLQPVFREGDLVAERENIAESRKRTLSALDALEQEFRRLDAPARYPVGLESRLGALKRRLVAEARKNCD
ncbi:MAG TPA: nicotinate phosphoribosyltransferase [Gammaproteobacteria bacterium]|nr:nicotinate phosphoribosyltransferase [Gammaproteobacteria bacterium]